jgi:hypothetical protein
LRHDETHRLRTVRYLQPDGTLAERIVQEHGWEPFGRRATRTERRGDSRDEIAVVSSEAFVLGAPLSSGRRRSRVLALMLDVVDPTNRALLVTRRRT